MIDWHGETVVDVPPRTVAHEGPVYERPYAAARLAGSGPGRPESIDLPRPAAATSLPRPCSGWSARPTSATSRGSPTSTTATCGATPCSPSPTTPECCASTRDSGLGIALATDCNGSFRAARSRTPGAQLALAEAYRNVATTGAEPLAITDCLNFGSPEDPGDHVAVQRGHPRAGGRLPDAWVTPVTGGNVSFYNQTGDTPILPTPVVGVLGVIDDVTRREPGGFQGSRGHVDLSAR